ncbi:MAG: hypothetical protein ACRD3C_26025 [Vicinamibacterales bacterium]
MRIASGKVVDGRVELDGELPEGSAVTVLALEGDETFEADADTEGILLEAIAQCGRGQITPMTDFLVELRRRERAGRFTSTSATSRRRRFAPLKTGGV